MLQRILGHNSLQMVNEVYARLADRDPFSEMIRLKQEMVKPALGALARPGFSGALEEFRTSLDRSREGMTKEAALEATKALESTIKCICDVRGWPYPPHATAKPLFDVIIQHGLVPPWMERGLMEVATIRNSASAHGQGPEPRPLPAHIADLAVNLAAAHIVALLAAHNAAP